MVIGSVWQNATFSFFSIRPYFSKLGCWCWSSSKIQGCPTTWAWPDPTFAALSGKVPLWPIKHSVSAAALLGSFLQGNCQIHMILFYNICACLFCFLQVWIWDNAAHKTERCWWAGKVQIWEPWCFLRSYHVFPVEMEMNMLLLTATGGNLFCVSASQHSRYAISSSLV